MLKFKVLFFNMKNKNTQHETKVQPNSQLLETSLTCALFSSSKTHWSLGQKHARLRDKC